MPVFGQLLGIMKKEVIVALVMVVNLVFIIVKDLCTAFLQEC